MKTLMITVGTRQVGWRCCDGIVRSFGADGDRGHPPHIDQLYAEFGLERGHHDNIAKDEFRWAARHLGEIAYHQCEQTQDFSCVELLMDGVILAQKVEHDLSHVILWGTDQPETTPWNFRRGDTLWLARLMAGHIQQRYPQLKVLVWNPVVAVNQVADIQKQLQGFLVTYALQQGLQSTEESFTLQIQTKGSAPQIASSLEICAAALMRQCGVEQVIPVEPEPLFETLDVTKKISRAHHAQDFTVVSLGQYFWPVERERILSAWQRGDFAEAKVWLETHRDRYQALYNLAGHLALATNWQWQETLKALQGIGWIDRPSTKQQASKALRKQWRTAIEAQYKINETAESKFLKLWESRLLVYLNLNRQNHTAAFMQTIQIVERLLFWRYQTEDWIKHGYLVPREGEKATWGTTYPASFGELIRAWRKQAQVSDTDPFFKSLIWANRKRNGIVHDNQSVTRYELSKFVDLPEDSPEPVIYQAIEHMLKQFCPGQWPMPERTLLQDLYDWGLQQLQADTAR